MKLPDRIYHLAEASNWPSIERNGLLPVRDLLRRAKVGRIFRALLERTQRLAHTELSNGVQIRDQRPMPSAALKSCLCGVTPAEWYALLNARVFFWLDPDRLNRQRAACEPRPQVVLTVDTTRLVSAYRDKVSLAPINTGNARRKPAVRGLATFVPYEAWIESGWASEAAALGTPLRKRPHRPVELTVASAIPDLIQFVIGVVELPPGQRFAPAALAGVDQTPPVYAESAIHDYAPPRS